MALTTEDKLEIRKMIREEVREVFAQFKSEMYEFFDPILKETQDNREERTIMSHKISDYEERISKLEQTPASS